MFAHKIATRKWKTLTGQTCDTTMMSLHVYCRQITTFLWQCVYFSGKAHWDLSECVNVCRALRLFCSSVNIQFSPTVVSEPFDYFKCAAIPAASNRLQTWAGLGFSRKVAVMYTKRKEDQLIGSLLWNRRCFRQWAEETCMLGTPSVWKWAMRTVALTELLAVREYRNPGPSAFFFSSLWLRI